MKRSSKHTFTLDSRHQIWDRLLILLTQWLNGGCRMKSRRKMRRRSSWTQLFDRIQDVLSSWDILATWLLAEWENTSDIYVSTRWSHASSPLAEALKKISWNYWHIITWVILLSMAKPLEPKALTESETSSFQIITTRSWNRGSYLSSKNCTRSKSPRTTQNSSPHPT